MNQPAPTPKKKQLLQIKNGIIIRKSMQVLKRDLRNTDRLITKITATSDPPAALLSKKKLLQLELDKAQACDPAKVDLYDNLYRSVRFFERIKVVRQLAKCKNDPDRLRSAQLDLVYVMYYPMGLRYIALFPSAPVDEDKRHEIKAHMARLVDAGIIDVQATVDACLAHQVVDKKKT